MADSKDLTLKAKSKEEIEMMVAITSLGLIVALKENSLEIIAAERFLFNPATLIYLRSLKAKKDVIELIHMGTELDNVKSLVPHSYDKALEEIRKLALDIIKRNGSKDFSDRKWIDSIED